MDPRIANLISLQNSKKKEYIAPLCEDKKSESVDIYENLQISKRKEYITPLCEDKKLETSDTCSSSDLIIKSQIEKLRNDIINMQNEIKEITNVVSEIEDHHGNDIPPEIRSSIKRLKEDMDSVMKKIQNLTDVNTKQTNRLIFLESNNDDLLNKFKIIDSKVDSTVNNDFPNLSSEVESIRERLEVIKKGTDDSFNLLRENIGKLNGQYSSILDKTNHDNMDLNDKISSTNDSVSSLKKRLDELPFTQQISNINSTLSQIGISLKEYNNRISSTADSLNSLNINLGSLSTDLLSYKSSQNDTNYELNGKITDLKSYLEQLKTDFNTSSKYLTDNIQKLLSDHTSDSDLDKIKSQIKILNSQLINTNVSLNSVIENIKGIDTLNKQNTKDIKSVRSDFIMKLTSQDARLNDFNSRLVNLEPLKSNVDSLNSQVNQIGSSVTKIQELITNYGTRLDNLESSDIQCQLNEIQRLLSQFQNMSDYPEFKEKVNSNTSSINGLKSQVTSLTASQNTNITNINSLKNAVSILQNTIEDYPNLSSQVSTNTTKINYLEQHFPNLENTTNLNSSHIAKLGNEIECLKTEILDLSSSTSNNSYDINQLKVDIQMAQDNVNSLTSNQSSLSASLANLQLLFNQLSESISTRISDILNNGEIGSIKSEISKLKSYDKQNDIINANTTSRMDKFELQLPKLNEAYVGVLDIKNQLVIFSNAKTQVEVLTAMMPGIQSTLSDLQTKVAILENESGSSSSIQLSITNLQNSMVTFQTQLSSVVASNTTIQSAVNLAQNQIALVSSRLPDFEFDLNTLKTEVEANSISISTISNSSASNNHSIINLQSSVGSLQNDINLIKAKLCDINPTPIPCNNNSCNESDHHNIRNEISTIKANIESLQKYVSELESKIGTGNPQPSEPWQPNNSGSMKWLSDYDFTTGKKDYNITSIQDLNESASLYVANKIFGFRGAKFIKGFEADKASFGYGLNSGGLVLDIKGNVKIDGTINDKSFEELGRGPKATYQFDTVSPNKVYSFSYSGGMPNSIRVMLDGIYPVKQSDTDGFTYWQSGGKISILTGTNSIGSYYTESGTRTSKVMGKYHVSVY